MGMSKDENPQCLCIRENHTMDIKKFYSPFTISCHTNGFYFRSQAMRVKFINQIICSMKSNIPFLLKYQICHVYFIAIHVFKFNFKNEKAIDGPNFRRSELNECARKNSLFRSWCISTYLYWNEMIKGAENLFE